MNLPLLPLLTLTLFVLAAGCGHNPNNNDAGTGGGSGGAGAGGGGTGGGGVGGGAPVTLPALCALVGQSSCAHTQRCGQLGAAQAPVCEAQLQARCEARVRAADAGSWRFDAVAAEGCFAQAAAVPCYGGPEDLTDCLDAALVAAGRLGAPCEAAECLEGYCPTGPGFDASCRACTAFTAQGQSCTSSNACNPSLGFCPLVAADGGAPSCEPLKGPGSRCLTGAECAARASCVNFYALDGGGTYCGPISLGERCGQANDCGPGAYCKALRIAADDTVTAGRCTTRLALGATCINEQYDDGCQGAGATCLDGKCKTAPPHSRPLSAECDSYFQCPAGAYCTCAGPLTDDGGISLRDGNCLSQQGALGACWFEEDYSMCLPGFTCVYPQKLCGAQRTQAQSCGDAIGACLGFLSCSDALTPGTAQCVAGRKVGESCFPTAPCVGSAFCALDAGAGTCVARLGADAGCSEDLHCASNRCRAADAGSACAAACW